MKFRNLLVLVAALMVMGLIASPQAAEVTEQNKLEGRRVAILIGEGFHDTETLVPMAYLINRGAEVTVVGIEPGELKAYNSDITVMVQKSVSGLSAADFDALIIPGGRSPANLRQNEAAVGFAREFVQSGKVTGAICHGPQVLVTAGVLENRKSTGVSGISDEIRAAGGEYHDLPVLRDQNLVTSRVPGDLPIFSKTLADALAEAQG